MADSHTHDLERVTRYGNGFSRYRCRTPNCGYWTDARDDGHPAEIDRLRDRVAQLTVALQALAAAAEQRLADPNWLPLLNARRVLERKT